VWLLVLYPSEQSIGEVVNMFSFQPIALSGCVQPVVALFPVIQFPEIVAIQLPMGNALICVGEECRLLVYQLSVNAGCRPHIVQLGISDVRELRQAERFRGGWSWRTAKLGEVSVIGSRSSHVLR
jgi:hypothetical protein